LGSFIVLVDPTNSSNDVSHLVAKKNAAIFGANASGKTTGEYVGRVAVRTSDSFNISAKELVQGIGHKYCQILHRKDGYSYQY
jgi:hypothetical protein